MKKIFLYLVLMCCLSANTIADDYPLQNSTVIKPYIPEYEIEYFDLSVEERDLGFHEVDGAILTAYCPCSACCGQYDDGITATGTVATEGRTIAVDPKVIPYGAHVEINGHEYIAEDTGSAMKKGGCRIDIFMESHQDCLQYGRRTATIRWWEQ